MANLNPPIIFCAHFRMTPSWLSWSASPCSDGEQSASTKMQRVNSASTTTRADDSLAGTITYLSSFVVMHSRWPNATAFFPSRPEGEIQLVRTTERPERHFADSFITVRLAIARATTTWLPRCPCCHRNDTSRRGRPPRPSRTPILTQ